MSTSIGRKRLAWKKGAIWGQCTRARSATLVQVATVVTLALAFSNRTSAQSPKPPRARDFLVFDMLIYKHKPDLTPFGMLPMLELGNNLWTGGIPVDGIDEPAFRRTVRSVYNYTGLAYLDIEQWPICGQSDSVSAVSYQKYARAVDIVREEAPGLRVGLYSVVPVPEYRGLATGDTAKQRIWEACNRRLAPLAAKVDFIMPSLYAPTADAKEWDPYAVATLRAARAFNKPVYAFLWPEYHEANQKLRGTNLPGLFWRHQLQVVRAGADGVVLWNAWRREWDDNAAWWLETKAFLRREPLGPRSN